LAVPYAAPKQVKTMADVQPIAPKKGYSTIVSIVIPSMMRGHDLEQGELSSLDRALMG
jgi:hypothetical protein